MRSNTMASSKEGISGVAVACINRLSLIIISISASTNMAIQTYQNKITYILIA